MTERDDRLARLRALAEDVDGLIEDCGGRYPGDPASDLRAELEASERDRKALVELENERARVQGNLCDAVMLLREYKGSEPGIASWLHDRYGEEA